MAMKGLENQSGCLAICRSIGVGELMIVIGLFTALMEM